jgi:S-adenosyl-L-methionine hydrolase (adenosine-forming)
MGFITLLSDFGTQDASAAIAKAIFMQYTPGATIIDITHEVTPFHTTEAAYLLAGAYKNFPPGTCHVVLFDLFSEQRSGVVLCEFDGHYFLTADNGVLSLAAGKQTVSSWECTASPGVFNNWLLAAGKTISELQDQKPESLRLRPYTLKTSSREYLPVAETGIIKGDVIHIDRYGNVVTNIKRGDVISTAGNRRFRLEFTGVEEITEVSDNYRDVRPGYKLCRFNSSDHLEICINGGRADHLFGLQLGGKFNDIKIVFE